MDEEILLNERDGAVSIITLNRPRSRNALNKALVETLLGALRGAAGDPAVRVIVLTGAGGAFCSGADLKSGLAENSDIVGTVDKAIDSYHAIISAIVHADKPVLAAVDGAAVGFGCDLALACDLRIASNEAYFQEKFVKIGLMPDGGGTFWLPRLVGLARAMEMMLTGDVVAAPRALEMGIVNRVVATGVLREQALQFAKELAKGPPLAFAGIKKAVREGGSIESALAAEKAGQLRCAASSDCVEGVMAWVQKREPQFQGQ